jgi:opacity protein-like surface antigen
MLRTMLRRTVVAASLLVMIAGTAEAQFARPIRFNVYGGAALPVGDFGSSDDNNPDAGFADLGFRLGAGLEFRPALMPIGFRLDGAYDRMRLEADDPVIGPIDGNYSIWSVTANAVLAPAVSPIYFIGGIGLYSVKATIDVDGGSFSSDSENEFGFNLGGGVQVPLSSVGAFIEARWTRVNLEVEGESNNIDYIPIVFGFRF